MAFEEVLNAAFVADIIWGVLLDPACIRSKCAAGDPIGSQKSEILAVRPQISIFVFPSLDLPPAHTDDGGYNYPPAHTYIFAFCWSLVVRSSVVFLGLFVSFAAYFSVQTGNDVRMIYTRSRGVCSVGVTGRLYPFFYFRQESTYVHTRRRCFLFGRLPLCGLLARVCPARLCAKAASDARQLFDVHQLERPSFRPPGTTHPYMSQQLSLIAKNVMSITKTARTLLAVKKGHQVLVPLLSYRHLPIPPRSARRGGASATAPA